MTHGPGFVGVDEASLALSSDTVPGVPWARRDLSPEKLPQSLPGCPCLLIPSPRC